MGASRGTAAGTWAPGKRGLAQATPPAVESRLEPGDMAPPGSSFCSPVYNSRFTIARHTFVQPLCYVVVT